MPSKAIADLEEMTDPRYDGIPGSDMEMFGSWELDDIEECNLHQNFVFGKVS